MLLNENNIYNGVIKRVSLIPIQKIDLEDFEFSVENFDSKWEAELVSPIKFDDFELFNFPYINGLDRINRFEPTKLTASYDNEFIVTSPIYDKNEYREFINLPIHGSLTEFEDLFGTIATPLVEKIVFVESYVENKKKLFLVVIPSYKLVIKLFVLSLKHYTSLLLVSNYLEQLVNIINFIFHSVGVIINNVLFNQINSIHLLINNLNLKWKIKNLTTNLVTNI